MRKKIIEKMPANVSFARKCLLFFSVFLMIAGAVLWIARGGYYMQWVYGVAVIGVGFFFLINYIVSIYFYGAALAKGYDDLAFLLLPFFFGIIGCLFVIAMPDRHSSQNKKNTQQSTKNKTGNSQSSEQGAHEEFYVNDIEDGKEYEDSDTEDESVPKSTKMIAIVLCLFIVLAIIWGISVF